MRVHLSKFMGIIYNAQKWNCTFHGTTASFFIKYVYLFVCLVMIWKLFTPVSWDTNTKQMTNSAVCRSIINYL
jgi:hypothetical protein